MSNKNSVAVPPSVVPIQEEATEFDPYKGYDGPNYNSLFTGKLDPEEKAKLDAVWPPKDKMMEMNHRDEMRRNGRRPWMKGPGPYPGVYCCTYFELKYGMKILAYFGVFTSTMLVLNGLTTFILGLVPLF